MSCRPQDRNSCNARYWLFPQFEGNGVWQQWRRKTKLLLDMLWHRGRIPLLFVNPDNAFALILILQLKCLVCCDKKFYLIIVFEKTKTLIWKVTTFNISLKTPRRLCWLHTCVYTGTEYNSTLSVSWWWLSRQFYTQSRVVLP